MAATKKQPLISVIIPVYNAESFLSTCLEYLIHQTYKNLEFVIVDDGSTDNSASVYKKYAKRDNRFKIVHQENSGPANARNKGLAMATGDYVHFHDSDDYVEQDYYEKIVNAITLSDADVICGEVVETGYMFPTFDRVHILCSLMDKIVVTRANLFNVVWRFVYKRSFLKKHKLKYPTNMFIGEDTQFMMRATYHAETIATAPGAKYHCISMPSSLGKNASKIMRGRANGVVAEHAEYNNFMSESGMQQMLSDINNGVLISRERYEFLRLPLLMKKHYSNGDIKFCVLGVPLFTRRQSHNRIQYFVFGLYVFRHYTRSA